MVKLENEAHDDNDSFQPVMIDEVIMGNSVPWLLLKTVKWQEFFQSGTMPEK